MNEKKLVPIWIVWESRKGEPDQIRAIDTKAENARRHKLALKHESETFDRDSQIWIEQTVLDHLYGHVDLLSLNGRGQQDYAEELLGGCQEPSSREVSSRKEKKPCQGHVVTGVERKNERK